MTFWLLSQFLTASEWAGRATLEDCDHELGLNEWNPQMKGRCYLSVSRLDTQQDKDQSCQHPAKSEFKVEERKKTTQELAAGIPLHIHSNMQLLQKQLSEVRYAKVEKEKMRLLTLHKSKTWSHVFPKTWFLSKETFRRPANPLSATQQGSRHPPIMRLYAKADTRFSLSAVWSSWSCGTLTKCCRNAFFKMDCSVFCPTLSPLQII